MQFTYEQQVAAQIEHDFFMGILGEEDGAKGAEPRYPNNHFYRFAYEKALKQFKKQ